MCRSALAFITLAEGIPIVYYGTEVPLAGRVAYDGNRAVLSQAVDLGATMRNMAGAYLYIKKLNWRAALCCECAARMRPGKGLCIGRVHAPLPDVSAHPMWRWVGRLQRRKQCGRRVCRRRFCSELGAELLSEQTALLPAVQTPASRGPAHWNALLRVPTFTGLLHPPGSAFGRCCGRGLRRAGVCAATQNPKTDGCAAAGRYRFQQALWDADFTELGFVQQDAATRDSTFAFARAGADSALTVVVLSNDFAERTVTLRDLPAAAHGRELCDIERLTCIWVSGAGRTAAGLHVECTD